MSKGIDSQKDKAKHLKQELEDTINCFGGKNLAFDRETKISTLVQKILLTVIKGSGLRMELER